MERDQLRREDLEKEREFVERRLSDLDRRRDAGLSDKLAAIEKLFQAIIATKSDAMSIAVSRVQGDNRDCAIRCGSQVRTFYELINSVRDTVLAQKLIVELFKNHVDELEKERDIEIAELETKLKEISASLIVFGKWQSNFWTVNVPGIIALVLTVAISMLGGIAWVLEYVKKLHGGG